MGIYPRLHHHPCLQSRWHELNDTPDCFFYYLRFPQIFRTRQWVIRDSATNVAAAGLSPLHIDVRTGRHTDCLRTDICITGSGTCIVGLGEKSITDDCYASSEQALSCLGYN